MCVEGIYRSSNAPLTDFIQFITNAFEHTDNCRTVLAGDIKFDFLNNLNSMRNNVDTFHQYGLINEVNLLTYVSPSVGIDTPSVNHSWHKLNCPWRSYVASPALSDQFALCVTFRSNRDSPPTSIQFRDFSEANEKLFASNIIFCSYPHSNTNEYAEYLVRFLKKNIEKNISRSDINHNAKTITFTMYYLLQLV